MGIDFSTVDSIVSKEGSAHEVCPRPSYAKVKELSALRSGDAEGRFWWENGRVFTEDGGWISDFIVEKSGVSMV